MKYIKSITVILLLLYSLTGCSYVSDYVEGQITNRASFSINAEYNPVTEEVNITWSETDSSDDFAGIEIYRSKNPNNESAPYFRINGSNITNNNGFYIDSDFKTPTLLDSGAYFYRVGFIHYDDREKSMDYNSATSISKVSGYAKVIIP